jgi:methyl-accepting chemotaxis protein
MKLGIRIPLLFGIVLLFTAAGVSIATVLLSASILKNTIEAAQDAETNANTDALSSKINGQMDVLAEIANRVRVRSMDWDTVRPTLVPDIPRVEALDFALIFPNGDAYSVKNGTFVNVTDRDYFKKAMAGGRAISVAPNRMSNSLGVMMAVPVRRDDTPNAAVIGVLMVMKDGTKMLSEVVAALRSSMKTGVYYMTDYEGTLIAHPNTEWVMNQFNPVKEVGSNPDLKSLADMLNVALKDKRGHGEYIFNGRNMLTYYDDVPGFDWILYNSMQEAELDAELNRIRFMAYGVGVIFILIGLLISSLLGRSIAKPVARVADTLKDISQGEGDLTVSIKTNSKDELGDLARYFNETIGKIKNLVLSIHKEAQTLSDIGNDLASNMNQTAAAVNEITANIQSIKGRIINQSASVSETHATMEQLVANIGKLNGHVDDQSKNVSQASSAIEQMVANTKSVTQTLIQNGENVQILMNASEVGRTGLTEVATDIQEIAKESEGLLQINSVMQNIASQTNLLSMNAAIEAAHAGESGKGFAVVADEIRKLAENSSAQSKTISAVLKKIKASIDKITSSTQKVLSKFEDIDLSIKVVADQEAGIRSSMEEQEIGNQQILSGVGNLKEINSQVQSGSNEMNEGAQEVIKESEALEKATQEISSGMNEMASGADQINTAVHQVNEISAKNRQGIAILIKEVSRFKVE